MSGWVGKWAMDRLGRRMGEWVNGWVDGWVGEDAGGRMSCWVNGWMDGWTPSRVPSTLVIIVQKVQMNHTSP